MTSDIPEGMGPGEQMVCAVCSRPLEELVTEGGLRQHFHSLVDGPMDHPAIPVNRSDLASVADKCDFCLADKPQWELNTNEFLGPIPGTGYDGIWLTCDICADLIARGLWSNLTRRSIDSHKAQHPDRTPAQEAMGELSIKALHRKVRDNVTRGIHRRDDI